jgi:hypothetical protein
MHTLIISLLILFTTQVQAECLPSEVGNFMHIEQSDIMQGRYSFKEILAHGEHLFIDKPNACDGLGRPATTGAGEKRVPIQPAFLRTSGPDSNSCSGCHAQPVAGGSGDFVANVFVLAQAKDPVTFSIAGDESNERNTLGMHGAGSIEMLAREMTRDLQTQAAKLPDGIHTLKTKGIDFKIEKLSGKITHAWGVDTDLVIKPFHQAGVVVSLRQFTVNAFNHHHGIQAEERFIDDFDEDGIARELTIGDVTAATLWQAHLPNPKQVLPKEPAALQQVQHGQTLFNQIGCAECHTPSLHLSTKKFVEPNPYNPANTWRDTNQSYAVTLPSQTVAAYTDLKRHNLCDDASAPNAIRFFCNEQLPQGRPDQDGHPGTEYFLTRKLWDVGSSAPYGHRGDLSTITEATLMHGGEGRLSRDQFASLPITDQSAVVAFLKTLRVH